MARLFGFTLVLFALTLSCRDPDIAWCPSAPDSLVGSWIAQNDSRDPYKLSFHADGSIQAAHVPAPRSAVPTRWQYSPATCVLTIVVLSGDSAMSPVNVGLSQSPPRFEMGTHAFSKQ
jgi:hypothetical protein